MCTNVSYRVRVECAISVRACAEVSRAVRSDARVARVAVEFLAGDFAKRGKRPVARARLMGRVRGLMR